MINVDLRKQPYNLDDEGVKWVEETIKSMTLEEKIGQLFINMGASRDEEYLKSASEDKVITAARARKSFDCHLSRKRSIRSPKT